MLRLRLRVAAEIERQARATSVGESARPRQILLLASAPTMYEEHAWDGGPDFIWDQQRAGDVLAIDRDVEDFIARCHTALRPCTW